MAPYVGVDDCRVDDPGFVVDRIAYPTEVCLRVLVVISLAAVLPTLNAELLEHDRLVSLARLLEVLKQVHLKLRRRKGQANASFLRISLQFCIGTGHLVFIANGPALYLVLGETVITCAEFLALGDGVVNERNVLAFLSVYLYFYIRWKPVEVEQDVEILFLGLPFTA